MEAGSLRRLTSAFRSGLRGIRARPLVFAISVGTMAAGLLVLGTYLLVVQNMRGVLDRFGQGLSVVAFLEPGASGDAASLGALRERLEGLEGVAHVRFVGPGQALERLRADLGPQAGVLDGLDENPLPASYEMELRPGSRQPEAVRRLAARVGEVPGVAEVRYGADWVAGYARVLRTLEWTGLGLGVFLFLVLGAIVAGTVRLAVYTRADEIQIQRLVGAGGLFVRLPFYIEGALQGGAAAALALAVLFGLFRLGLPVVGDLLSFLLGRRAPEFLGPGEMALILLLGTGLGVGGAVLSLLRLEERS